MTANKRLQKIRRIATIRIAMHYLEIAAHEVSAMGAEDGLIPPRLSLEIEALRWRTVEVQDKALEIENELLTRRQK